ncbi:MAG: hypothetical protein UH850_10925 [Paludibacteraceae bacterium]|nr:hypothetical protein [Paludibacteraceae bacterium]
MALEKSDIKTCLGSLRVRDYKLKHNVSSYEFKKLNKETGDRYHIMINYDKAYNGYCFYEPISYVLFSEIEDILRPLYKKYNLFDDEVTDTVCDAPINYSSMNHEYFRINKTIESVEAFEPLRQEMQRIIDDLSLPFIDKYSNLENVADMISRLRMEEIGAFVNYLGSAHIRAAYILKRTGHVSFRRRLNEFYDSLCKFYICKKKEYGEDHWYVKDYLNTILAMNEFFCEDLESLGFRFDHIWEKEE